LRGIYVMFIAVIHNMRRFSELFAMTCFVVS
jgi:hypothetical protein